MGNEAFEYTTDDGNTISSGNGWISSEGSGITVRQGLRGHLNNIETLAHEYGHYLFGQGHSNYSGIMGGRTYALNGWERIELGYITPTIPTTDGQTITLGDFIADGDIVKIEVTSSTFFLIENHQRVSHYDQIMRGGSIEGGYDFSTTLGSGIYVCLITSGSSHPITVEPKTADGSWDWALDGTISMPAGWPATMPLTTRSSVNRNTGRSDRHPQNIFWNNEWWSKWHENADPNITDPPTNFYELNRDVMGDETDAFNLGYNELFTPWSNPSSYASGTTNISLELVSKSGNDITVKVYSTSSSAEALPPSKPQNVKILYTDPDHPTIGWDANTEPDINGYEIYRSYDTGSFTRIATVGSGVTSYTDQEITYTKPIWEKDVNYKIKAKDNASQTSIFSEEANTSGIIDLLPKKNGSEENKLVNGFVLDQNYPNPFNPTTVISFQLPKQEHATLKVYNALGKEVAVLMDRTISAGRHIVEFNASLLPSGVYFYKLNAGNLSQIRKMILMK